ncbi:hypothetical protein ACF3M1_16690 [Luteimonas sp. WGS1318]|uniref:hypothetical protein n=1 Tax=Luteimonas sp. WGS1318 TaxID=3366815 RepID=UPI00372D0729
MDNDSEALARFKAAFIRLRESRPERIDKSAKITQANIAREAGCDPSALRKSRFPDLILEIQEFAGALTPPKDRVSPDTGRKKSRDLRTRLAAVRLQRDELARRLVEADARILELGFELRQLRGEEEATSNVVALRPDANRSAD